jgi:hypothetical protein
MKSQAQTNLEMKGCFNLLGRIIDDAVKDFNEGTLAQRADAASFFRSEEDFGWMLSFSNGSMKKFIATRLDGDPFDLDSLKRKRIRKPVKVCKPAKLIKWKGREQTISEWAEELGLTYKTMRARLGRHGICEHAFRVGQPGYRHSK